MKHAESGDQSHTNQWLGSSPVRTNANNTKFKGQTLVVNTQENKSIDHEIAHLTSIPHLN